MRKNFASTKNMQMKEETRCAVHTIIDLCENLELEESEAVKALVMAAGCMFVDPDGLEKMAKVTADYLREKMVNLEAEDTIGLN